jgi:hypothetical protein
MPRRRSKSDSIAPDKPKAEKPKIEELKAPAKPIENRKPRKPIPQDIRLSARQFCRARGYRWERCAGFLHEMKTQHPGDKTRPEWDQLWAAFWGRAVK